MLAAMAIGAISCQENKKGPQMDFDSLATEQRSVSDSSTSTLTVYFTNPTVWARLPSHPQPYWKLAGEGTISFEGDRIILRGRRPRPFWFAAPYETAFGRADISNVVREQTLIQCHVRMAGATRILRLWLKDSASAEQLVDKLPQEHTAEFDRQLAEHTSFNAALATLPTGTPVVLALLIANIAMFTVTAFAGGGLFQANGAVLVNWGTNYGPRTLEGEWWRLLSSSFLHFGVLHIALNMWALWSIGPLTERLFGSAYFLVLYLFAGLCGSFASLYWHPDINSAGASGAIFGVLGGLLAFMVNPRTRIPPSIAATHRNSALVFIAYNLVNGAAHAGIDNAAHIGGLVSGIAMGFVLARPLDQDSRQDPLPRLSLGILLSMIILGTLWWPYRHPDPTTIADRKFRQQYKLFVAAERDALDYQSRLDQLVSSNEITREEWGRRVRSNVLYKWEKAENQIADTKLPDSSRFVPLRTALLEYLEQKRFALDLLGEAARNNDPEKLEWGRDVNTRNKSKEQQVRRLIEQINP
ncbi:MAG: rhomboid family intramembrane serine protease [Proteobacteria bacterium]|nr:rhomboid family intramembrane serine protease [Pseudomonadota bacterium]